MPIRNLSQAEFLKALQARAGVRYNAPPRLVLAFYYGWYGAPEVSGKWLHWEGVDAQRKHIATSTHYPVLGAYDSNDLKVIEQHCQWARAAGLDGFIYSWWGIGGYEEKPLPRLLDTAQRHRLKVCLYYEQVPQPGDPRSVLPDLRHILREFAKHPAYLKVDGRPVLFVYGRAMEQLSLSQWAWALETIRAEFPHGMCAIGDSLGRSAARVFDGIHTYNPVGVLEGKPLDAIQPTLEAHYREAIQTAGELGRIACATIIPAYDDTKIRTPGIRTNRFGGEAYRKQWNAVLSLNPDWVLITSFNEWHEGSEIEPSVEHGEREVRTTAAYAPRFKRLPERPRMATPLTALTGEAIAALRRAWEGKTIGVLPDAQSEALFWLLQVGLPVEALEYADMVAPNRLTPTRYAALVYAGGESYRASINAPDDVDRALEAYLQAGGVLLALPSAPLPFYYADGKAVNRAGKFGLPIAVSAEPPEAGKTGFETPPTQGMQFRWNRTALPRMGDAPLPFPTGGDLRWRPALRTLARPDADYTPLATLYDAQGRNWGDGAVWIRYPSGGAVGYVWFRLLETPYAPILLARLFEYAAQKH
jgi:glycoprotein endo-alpha-1,2-mannosidase